MKFVEDPSFRRAFLNSEPHAVNAFVEHFVTVLTKLGRARGLSPEESEDCVQECFGVFFRKLAEINPDVKLSTYLFGIHINSVREVRRKRGRVEAHGDLEAIEHLVSQQYDEKGHWKTGVAPKPIDRLLENEEAKYLQDCLEGLPEKHKEAVLLTLSEDADGKELCHILGVSYANFRQLMTRARHALRLCLENYVGEV